MATTAENRAEQLKKLASAIRFNPTDRESIAQGFELIAEAMAPCEDCGRHPEQGDAHPGDGTAFGYILERVQAHQRDPLNAGFDADRDTTGTA